MKLRKYTTVTLRPTAPFNFDGTFHKPSHFEDGCSLWRHGSYWRAIRLGNRIFGIRIDDRGKLVRPKLNVTIFSNRKVSDKDADTIKKELIWRFGLDENLTEFDKLMKSDKRFYPVFKRWRGMRNADSEDLYGLLMISIVLQNATIKRTVQMMNALLEEYGTRVEFDNKAVWLIWLPKDMTDVSEEELRSLKVGYRAKFIKRLSQDFAEGKVDEYRLRGMDKESVKKELMKLYGVGPETARVLLSEIYHHHNTFEHIAPWQQKIYSMLFYNKKFVSAEKIKKDINRQYGEYAMLAVHYMMEDIFWRRKNEHIEWLEKEIRL